MTQGTHLHLLWTCATLPGSQDPKALYRARSEDGGLTWAGAQPGSDRAASAGWILAAANGELHIVWESPEASGRSAWHARSLDDGQTWSGPVNIGLASSGTGLSALAADPAGGLHLVQESSGAEGTSLVYWRWDGATWRLDEGLAVGGRGGALLALQAVTEPTGRLVVAFARHGLPTADNAAPVEMLFSSRPVPAAETVSWPTPTTAPGGAEGLPATPGATPAATV